MYGWESGINQCILIFMVVSELQMNFRQVLHINPNFTASPGVRHVILNFALRCVYGVMVEDDFACLVVVSLALTVGLFIVASAFLVVFV
ncbi:hypothetical protein BDR04DRAFT_325743 [Suillus decipiens]|nr:hypothetical protein BDR04DRAFT_325743 [Suillus decipiens]